MPAKKNQISKSQSPESTDTNPQSEARLIAIASIRTDGGTQPRGAIDYSVVESYQDAMEIGAKFPAVDVFYDGTNYWLADGFHRVQASFQAGRDEIECHVHQGTLEDAQWFSYGANKTNGLYRSNADKQRAVQAALKHPKSAELSDSAIAKHCGVNQQTVANWRQKLGASSEIRKIETRTVTRNGKTYQQNTSNIGKRPAAPAPSAPTQTIAPVIPIQQPAARIPEPVQQKAIEQHREETVPVQQAPAPLAVESSPVATEPDYDELNRLCGAVEKISMTTASPADLAAYVNSSGWMDAIESAKRFLNEVLIAQRAEKRTA